MNFGIKNRWEQRALQEVLQNKDVREAKHKDYSKRDKAMIGHQLQEFNSVDEIYFFMESMFQDGLDEHHVSLALNIFIRDAAFFEEEDL